MKINEAVEKIEKLRVLTLSPDARVPYSSLDDNAVDYSPKVDASNFTFTVKYDIHASNIEDIDIETHPQINFWIGFLSSAEKIKTCDCSGRNRRKTPTDLEHMYSKEFYRFYNVYTKQVIMSCNTDPCKVTITIEVNLGPDSGSASITSFVFLVNTDKFSTTTVKVARTTTGNPGQGIHL